METPNPNWSRNFLTVPTVHVLLIVRPFKVPRHTYNQVSLRLYKSETVNLVWCYLFKGKQRIATLKRSFDISL